MNEESLMMSRIRKILMICSNCDAFSLREDGRVETQVINEYRERNLSNPPRFAFLPERFQSLPCELISGEDALGLSKSS